MRHDPLPLQAADPQQGWPRVVARTILGGLGLAAFHGPLPYEIPDSVVSLSRAGWEALVRLYARRYPARFAALAREEMGAAGRRSFEEAGGDAR
jgi:hypothetical protein